jgi:dihydrofolate reductase
MRKIINSAFLSLDGVTDDPRSWAIFDSDSAGEAAQPLQAYDGMLMGRGTYEYFAELVPEQTGPYADAINAILKAVRPGVATSPPGPNHIRAAGPPSLPRV